MLIRPVCRSGQYVVVSQSRSACSIVENSEAELCFIGMSKICG